MPKQTRVVGYCFTINNPTNEEIEELKKIDCKYICLGYERGEEGTPHVQGYVHFKRNTHFNAAKRLLPRAHIEARKGSVAQAVDYCKKDGVFQEFGTMPLSQGDAAKTCWKTIMEKAQLGEFTWIMDNYPRVWIQLSNRLEGLRLRKTQILDGELQHEWWTGPTGSGKSSTLWKYYGSHYQKELNKWWCGYENESVVAIEEWSPKNECTGSQLKIWADRYPFTGQIKGGSIKKVRPLKIIVLSNFDIDSCFSDARDLEPLKRRFTTFKFPQDIDRVVDRARSFISDHCSIADPSAAPIASRTDETASSSDSDMPPLCGPVLDTLGCGCEESDQAIIDFLDL